MTRTTARTAAALAVSLGLVLSGCGSDSALSAKEFRSQANALCKKAASDTEKLGQGLSETSSEKDVTSAIDKLVARNDKLADAIEDLDEPSSMSADVKKMLKDLRAGLKKLGDASLTELNALGDPFADADKTADKLKLDECSH